MATESPIWNEQRRAWASLRTLRPTSIDLERISLIREKPLEELRRPADLERLLLELGLNDEGIDELPPTLHPFCGGLKIWQYPSQFGPYLALLSRLHVRSYLEVGVRHGGCFVATTEILNRFSPIELAVGVDIIPAPSMEGYAKRNPRIEFACLNTQSDAFNALIQRIAPIDLVFIDSHHEESQCRREFAAVSNVADMVAFHDIAHVNWSGVAKVWNEVKQMDGYRCYEFTAQYEGMGPYMGIGLAVKKERLRSSLVTCIKQIIERVKGKSGMAAALSDTADMINDVGLDSLEMLRFMLELEERMSIQIDFDSLEYSYFHSILSLAEFLESMPLQQSSRT